MIRGRYKPGGPRVQRADAARNMCSCYAPKLLPRRLHRLQGAPRPLLITPSLIWVSMSPPDASPGQPGSAGPAERPSPFVDHPSQYNATIEAWAEAWEEVCDAPSTALSGSPLLGSSCLAHRLCPSAEEVATVKRQEAEQGGPSWGEEAARLLHLALPLSVRRRRERPRTPLTSAHCCLPRPSDRGPLPRVTCLLLRIRCRNCQVCDLWHGASRVALLPSHTPHAASAPPLPTLPLLRSCPTWRVTL